MLSYCCTAPRPYGTAKLRHFSRFASPAIVSGPPFEFRTKIVAALNQVQRDDNGLLVEIDTTKINASKEKLYLATVNGFGTEGAARLHPLTRVNLSAGYRFFDSLKATWGGGGVPHRFAGRRTALTFPVFAPPQ